MVDSPQLRRFAGSVTWALLAGIVCSPAAAEPLDADAPAELDATDTEAVDAVAPAVDATDADTGAPDTPPAGDTGGETDTPDGADRMTRIDDFSLVRADDGEPIAAYDPVPPRTTLNLAALPVERFDLRANTTPADVGSVRFDLDGRLNVRTDNSAPYTIGQPEAGWEPTEGRRTIQAIPYALDELGGRPGRLARLQLQVIDEPETNARPAILIEAPPVGTQKTAPARFRVRVKAEDVDGRVERVDIAVREGPTARASRRADGRWVAEVGPVGQGVRFIEAYALDDRGDLGEATVRVRVLAGPATDTGSGDAEADSAGDTRADATVDTADVDGAALDTAAPPICSCASTGSAPGPAGLLVVLAGLVGRPRRHRSG